MRSAYVKFFHLHRNWGSGIWGDPGPCNATNQYVSNAHAWVRTDACELEENELQRT